MWEREVRNVHFSAEGEGREVYSESPFQGNGFFIRHDHHHEKRLAAEVRVATVFAKKAAWRCAAGEWR